MQLKSTGLIGVGKWGKILKGKIEKHSRLLFSANSKSKYQNKLKKLEWVFIATPDSTHKKIVNKCLKEKINIFCEKPLTRSYLESSKLFLKAQKLDVKLFVDEIQSYTNKKIKLKKINYISRKKNGYGKPKDLLYRSGYHDFYFLYDQLYNKKIKKIKILDSNKDLKFYLKYKNLILNFDYSLNSIKKIHSINKTNLITKKDILSKMIIDVINKKVDFNKNKKKSLFANKLIDKIKNEF